MIKTGFIPFESTTNNHVQIIKGILNKQGYEVYNPLDKNCPKLKIINLNWFESIYGNNLITVYLKYIRKKAIINAWKNKKIKIIYTMHNKLPHDTKYSNLIKKFVVFLCKKSDAIIVMSNISFEYIKNELNLPEAIKKTYHIPLPRYSSNDDINTLTFNTQKDNNSLNLLFFGVVKPYKNIELLIQILNELQDKNIKLLICGKPINNDYGTHLNNLIKNKNIKTNFSFLNDSELSEQIKNTDCIILPYDKKSSLNSGAAIHAFSLGKTVIAPKIGTILDMPEDSVFSYDYDNKEEHYNNLKQAILDVYTLFTTDKEKFKQKSLKAYEFIKENNSPDKLGKLYNKIYELVQK